MKVAVLVDEAGRVAAFEPGFRELRLYRIEGERAVPEGSRVLPGTQTPPSLSGDPFGTRGLGYRAFDLWGLLEGCEALVASAFEPNLAFSLRSLGVKMVATGERDPQKAALAAARALG